MFKNPLEKGQMKLLLMLKIYQYLLEKELKHALKNLL